MNVVKSLAEINEADCSRDLVLLAFINDISENEDLLST